MNLQHAEIEALLGAYALDAVDADEREAIEQHLANCPRCRAEVADHRDVASLLAMSGAPAPEGIWDRIVGSIDAELPPSLVLPPVLPLPSGTDRARRVAGGDRRRRRWLVAAGAAVAAVAASVIGVLGVKVVEQGNRIDDLVAEGPGGEGNRLEEAAQSAWAASEGRHTTMVSTDGAVAVRAVITPDGRGYVLADDIPRLPVGKTYQLWGVAGETVLSLGVLGPDVDVAAFHADDAVAALAITAEDSPGVVTSTEAATAQGLLS